ncbi:N-acetylmuramoyl-L-alanine amidase [Symbiobacterium thermophilum]|uniref:Putative N-acetylmuramoyl-L-alanine amidase n=1 Tax=Symbiobacterium thermophilum (strain DSM 24528 / JCM 14929 / IAM 14863 / T) TaxID=292459 RepID=Q67QM9_SYMTH|nr:SH3 domain-containing protein [Symbiobacterium thermophilum]BAD40014.1 putative N-acetylmuramoyl-L-alanine amidase [Symbiobacterium thermophilum IAM 14863]
MKRVAAAAFVWVLLSSVPAEAATLRPLDQDGLNVRSGPGTEYAIIGGLGYDQWATVLGREGDWYRVRLQSGAEGWVAAWFSRVLLEDEFRYAVVETDILNVRREPGLDAPVLTRVYQGQYVRLLEMIPEWWRIQLDDGTEGWVFAQYVRQAAGPPGGQPVEPGAGEAPAPVTPPASQPPAAPPGTVPDVSFPPPSEPVPDPAKVVSVVQETGIYAGPNSEARRTDTVRPGERLRLLDARDGWVRVASPQDRWGWVPGELVQVVDGPLRIQVAESGWSVEKPAAQQPAGRQPGAAEIVAGDAVVGPRGATLHLIPATAARVLAELSPGEPLEVLDRDGQWVKVRLSSGQVGWTRGALLEQPPAPPADGAPDDGEREGVDAGGAADEGAAGPGEEDRGFAVRMRQGAPGVYVLEVTAPGRSLGAPRLEGRTLRVPFSTGLDGERAMPLNQMGVARAVLTRDGLTLTLTGEPRVAVESALDGTLLVTLRPAVTEIRREGVGDNGVLRFTVRGTVQPRARAEAGQIIVEFPGAVLGTAQAPAGVQAVETATGVRVVLPSNRPFALKPWEGGYDLVTYGSGLAGKVIMLDPGHGGDDGGAVSRATGVVEKAVNLQVALRLRALLAEKGATVYMTRADDRRAAPDEFLRSVDGEPWDQLDLQYRTMLANHLGVDLFLSIHHNSGETLSQGTEVYYTSWTLNGGRSRELASLVQQELVRALGTRDRGVFDDTFFVTRNTLAPAVLVELAFINNPAEGPRTVDPAFQEAAAQAIVRALERFYAER